MALIEVRNLKKYYKVGDNIIKALDGINLDIEKGEFIALLGTCLLYTSDAADDLTTV